MSLVHYCSLLANSLPATIENPFIHPFFEPAKFLLGSPLEIVKQLTATMFSDKIIKALEEAMQGPRKYEKEVF